MAVRGRSRRFFSLEAIDMGGARCVGSVYGALRGRACQGQQLNRLGRNTGLQVLSGWASAYGLRALQGRSGRLARRCLPCAGRKAGRGGREEAFPAFSEAGVRGCTQASGSWGPVSDRTSRLMTLRVSIKRLGQRVSTSGCTNERAAVRLTPGYSHADSDHRRSPTQSAGRGTQKRAQH